MNRPSMTPSTMSPCSWAGFGGFRFASKPAQHKYAGATWLGFRRIPTVLNSLLVWFGYSVHMG
jgi:hypothetical protein